LEGRKLVSLGRMGKRKGKLTNRLLSFCDALYGEKNVSYQRGEVTMGKCFRLFIELEKV